MTSATEITIRTHVRADLCIVWNALISPDAIVRWNFAIPEWHCPSASCDPVVGGRYTYRMEARDGSMGFDFGGRFTKVVPMETLASVLDDGRTVVIGLQRNGGGVEVVETFQAEGTNPVELQRQGWQAILDNLGAYVEGVAQPPGAADRGG
ncbi:MAG: SRPBCC domain-containing protein [Steroidobacteraceae bacterium]